MQRFVILLWLLVFAPTLFASPQTTTDNVIGQQLNFKLHDSEQMLSSYFWTPNNSEKTPLPLLVVLDGQRYFAFATSMHHMAQDYSWTPKFAVLSINLEENRWSTYMQQRAKVLQTLATEVFPYLEKQHNVSQQRILFGWEAAGGFALRTLADQPGLFNSYIAASPSPLYGDYFPSLEQDHQKMMATLSDNTLQAHLYLAQGQYDYPQYQGIETLVASLKNNASKSLRWRFEQIDDTSHADIGFEALFRGLRDYFYYYNKPSFTNYEHYTKQGGSNYLDQYFKKQASLYGFEQARIVQNRFKTLRTLSFMLLMDNNVAGFQTFLADLDNSEFLDKSHLNHIFRYAEFLLLANDTKGATALFDYLKERHPKDARPVFGLGLVAQAKQDTATAIANYQDAIAKATAQQDFRLSEYQQQLEQILALQSAD